MAPVKLMNKTIRNERRKLTASWFNTLAPRSWPLVCLRRWRRKSTVLGRIAPIKPWWLLVPPFAVRQV
jgi:hypothetical protein